LLIATLAVVLRAEAVERAASALLPDGITSRSATPYGRGSGATSSPTLRSKATASSQTLRELGYRPFH
jgi:hypothetical protein